MMLRYILRKEHCEGFAINHLKTNQRMSRETNEKLTDNVSLKLRISAEKYDDTHIQLRLDAIAELSDIAATDILETLKDVNSVMYNAYMDIVTEDIIQIMESE
ncbi:MAG: hypothetical protein HUJ98_07335 [Bacteroidaceae bacterium]|nr:hypothetical protein [Bacteroidaceae bacterium]